MADNDTIRYLKENYGEKFSIVEFFEHFAFIEEDDGTQEFKRAIGTLVTMKDAAYVVGKRNPCEGFHGMFILIPYKLYKSKNY